MDAYSLDLRERVVRACDEAEGTREEIAEMFSVSVSFITKLLRRRRQEQTIAAKPHSGGGKPSLDETHLQQLRELVDEQPDATLVELCQRLRQRAGKAVHSWTLCRALKRLGLVRKKKSLHATERDTPRVTNLRRQWCRTVAQIDQRKLVFVDESGVNTAMTRSRGRAEKGQRVHGAVPHGDWKTVTMLGAIRADGMAAAATAPFSTDTALFRMFVNEALVPVLHRGDVVVWDGLAPHKAAGLREAVQSVGAELMPLPPYSPDLSPIEPCWSKVKEMVRAAGPRDERAIGKATTRAFAAVTAADARGWFRHCGYLVH